MLDEYGQFDPFWLWRLMFITQEQLLAMPPANDWIH